MKGLLARKNGSDPRAVYMNKREDLCPWAYFPTWSDRSLCVSPPFTSEGIKKGTRYSEVEIFSSPKFLCSYCAGMETFWNEDANRVETGRKLKRIILYIGNARLVNLRFWVLIRKLEPACRSGRVRALHGPLFLSPKIAAVSSTPPVRVSILIND